MREPLNQAGIIMISALALCICICIGHPLFLGHPMFFLDTLCFFLVHPMYIFADDRHAGR